MDYEELRQSIIRRVSATASCAIDVPQDERPYYDGAIDAYEAVLEMMTDAEATT